MQGTVIRRDSEPGEPKCCSQELAPWVEHALLARPLNSGIE